MDRPTLARSFNWRTGLPEWPYSETFRQWQVEQTAMRKAWNLNEKHIRSTESGFPLSNAARD